MPKRIAKKPTRKQILAFRLSGHHLSRRVPLAQVLDAAGAIGLPNGAPGSAELSLHARVEGLTPARFERLVFDEKKLVHTFGPRGVPWVVPARDLAVFTLGALPDDEAGWRLAFSGFTKVLDGLGLSAVETHAKVLPKVLSTLNRRELPPRQLGNALAKKLPRELRPYLRPETFHRFGEALLRPLALTGGLLLSPRGDDDEPWLLRTADWLERTPRNERPAKRELVRRYLRCHGPSTAEAFASWAGLPFDQGRRMFAAVKDELVETGVGFVVANDLAELRDAERPRGLWLLPPNDPLLQLRDRELLVPDVKLHRELWRQAKPPGAILSSGEVVGTFRAEKRGTNLRLSTSLFRPLKSTERTLLDGEALTLAAWRGATAVALDLE